MPNLSDDAVTKMRTFIKERNNPARLGMVEVVAQYVVHDLDDLALEDKEEALTMARYHLSTDRGLEDLKALLPSAVGWASTDAPGLEYK